MERTSVRVSEQTKERTSGQLTELTNEGTKERTRNERTNQRKNEWMSKAITQRGGHSHRTLSNVWVQSLLCKSCAYAEKCQSFHIYDVKVARIQTLKSFSNQLK